MGALIGYVSQPHSHTQPSCLHQSGRLQDKLYLESESLHGPFDRKWVFGVISGNLHIYAPNYTLVFNTFLAKNAC